MTASRPLRRLYDAIGGRLARMPIRLKLAATFAAMMIVLFGAMFLLLYIQYSAGLSNTINSSLAARTADLAVIASESQAHLSAHAELPQGSGGFAQIISPTGQVLASTVGLRRSPLMTAAELARTGGGPVSVGSETEQLRAVRVANGNVLIVGASLEDRNNALKSLQTVLFVGGPIGLLIACAAGYAVASRALAPVERMRAEVDDLYGFQFSARLDVPPAHDEIRRLGDTLNEMLARIEDVVGRGRAFVAGASHELRTPLTILELELEDALAGERSIEELQAAIESARVEVHRLTALAEDLLVIAQTDQKRLPVEVELLEAGAVLRMIADRYSQLGELVGREVTIAPGPPLPLEADLARLDQALSNLVNNALRFSDGPVELRAGRRGPDVELHVLDSGPGFPNEFLGRAFERFSRGDPARARGGVGLGLAIVRAIAEAHGGSAHAANRPGGGADVWVRLPARVAPASVEPATQEPAPDAPVS